MSDISGITTYIEGGTARLVAQLRDANGDPVVGNTMRLVVLPPGSTASYVAESTTEDDLCIAVVPLTTHGVWRYRFESLVEPYAVYESTFMVARRTVPAPVE